MKKIFCKRITSIILTVMMILTVLAAPTASVFALQDNAPVISSATSSFGGVKLEWDNVEGASKYLVFKKTEFTDFIQISETADTGFVDADVENGIIYTYAVKAADGEGQPIGDLGAEKSISYVEAPKITKIKNNMGSAVITWNKVEGAPKYRLYLYDEEKGWRTIRLTKTTSYTHKGLENGKVYTYTVRCVDEQGGFLSGFDPKGVKNRYLSPIKITSIKRSGSSNVIKWPKVSSASFYRVLRTTVGNSRKKLADANTNSYTDKTAKAGVAYKYTVLAYNTKQQYITYFNDKKEKYYSSGKLANGVFSHKNGKTRLVDGVEKEKLVTKSGAKYYYNSKGTLMKNGIVGSSKMGYYYADKKGKINTNYCAPIVYNGKKWNVICGTATQVKTEKQKTLYRALGFVKNVTNTSMTKEEKLKKCFNYMAKNCKEYNPRIPHYHGSDWYTLYANDIFIEKGGNCFSYGAAFAFVAKAIGYKNVYACNSGGHGWAEVEGLVYDPERSRWDKKSTFYGLKYTNKYVSHYKSAISDGKSWKYVKI